MELKNHQEPLSVEEQICNLKSQGLIIEDEEYAKMTLSDISYFRLIKAYSLGLKVKNGNYYKDIKFEHIVDLYLFNSNFRQLLFSQIERIEVNMRARISNHFSLKYGVLGYLNSNNFENVDYHNKFMEDIFLEIKRNTKSPFVKNFKENYQGGQLPMYALLEIVSFGSLSKLYKNMKSEDKKEISSTFGLPYTYLESWIEAIAYVRNICAHYGRLYNVKLSKTPRLYKKYTSKCIRSNRIFGILICMKEILLRDKERWNLFVEKIYELSVEYENVDLTSMGFVDGWKNILLI